jgi:hypothetical protein
MRPPPGPSLKAHYGTMRRGEHVAVLLNDRTHMVVRFV